MTAGRWGRPRREITGTCFKMLYFFFFFFCSPPFPRFCGFQFSLSGLQDPTPGGKTGGCLFSQQMQEFPEHLVKKPHGEVGQLGKQEVVNTGQPILREMQRAWGTEELNHRQVLQWYLIVTVGKAIVNISSRWCLLLVSFSLQGTLKVTKCVLIKNNTKNPQNWP